MAEYRFLTTWLSTRPARRVGGDRGRRGVARVVARRRAREELDPGDEERVGSRYRIAWRSRLPYPIEFEFSVDRVERPSLMEGRAVGELDGTGRWRLLEHGGITAVTYEWNVATTKRWMNLLAPVARPVFAWNHDWVMARGGEGLARRLGARLVSHG